MASVAAPGFASRLRTHLAWRGDDGEVLADVIATSLGAQGSVIDIGCGGGVLLDELSRRGYRVAGVERDASTVAMRNQHVTVLEGSAESLPASLARGSYDGVVFSHVMEHLVDPVAAMRNAAGLLKPDGLLFCEVPNNEALIAKQSGLSWEHLDIPRHINFFTEQSLRVLAENAGLAVKRVYFSGYCRYFSDSYIATEQRIFDQIAIHPDSTSHATRNSQGRAWRLLAKTIAAGPRLKYDSVGFVAGFSTPSPSGRD